MNIDRSMPATGATATGAAGAGKDGAVESVAVGATAPASLLSLTEAVLDLTLGYLDSGGLAACIETCRVFGLAAQRDDLWRDKCLEDWGEERKVRPQQRSEVLPTFLESWRAWRRAFNRYSAADVKRVAVWWAAVEEWMSQNLPEVMGTLNTGVSEEDLDQAERDLGWPLPTHLRLLYRFHNGQWLPWDEALMDSMGFDKGRPQVLPEVVGSGKSLGLLGGYCHYDTMMTSRLFSLHRGVAGGVVMVKAFAGESQRYFQASANRWGTDLDTIRARGGFLLAAAPDMSKRTWVGRDGNVRFDGQGGSLMGVFDAAPVTAPSPRSDAALGSGGGGNLMAWLEEYLRRLQCGHYGVRSKWRESVQLPGEEVRESRLLRGVWLFPREGGEGCVTDITKGVEIQVAPVFLPEECQHRKNLLWAYTVRMRLLRDHPSRPPAMSSCQLSTRQWDIKGPDGYRETVSGAGVIGKYPLLRVAAPPTGNVPGNASGDLHMDDSADEGFFEYESRIPLKGAPGTMGGHFSFTPGDRFSPTGRSFNARVPTFDLVLPAFMF